MKQELDVKRIISSLASQEGISEAFIRKEMERAIEMARQSKDPMIQSQWKKVPCKGEIPTVEELICYIASSMESKQSGK